MQPVIKVANCVIRTEKDFRHKKNFATKKNITFIKYAIILL